MIEFELAVLDRLQMIHTPWLDRLMLGASYLGSGVGIWLILAVILLLIRRTRRQGLVLTAALLLSLLVCNLLLKNIVARPRPFSYSDVELLLKAPQDWSFPSGHSSAAFAAAMALRDSGRRYSLFAFILAALIAFSRLYLYVHFPTDVLAGCLIGLLCGLCARHLISAAQKRLSAHSRS